ncbi:MAG: BLUF domain-containing protein [Planctomycetes bacterium]|nr:BLUF domain-containing protein [Planctomycetota bacterium]
MEPAPPDDQPELLQLIYASASNVEFAEAELIELLQKSRRKNVQVDISGVLLYHAGAFVQVIEGPPAEVERLFASIKTDARHGDITLLDRRRVEERSFADWAMGFVRPTKADFERVDGLLWFFDDDNLAARWTNDPDRARCVLLAFRDGLYRRA